MSWEFYERQLGFIGVLVSVYGFVEELINSRLNISTRTMVNYSSAIVGGKDVPRLHRKRDSVQSSFFGKSSSDRN